MNTAVMLPPEMMDAVIVSSMFAGVQRDGLQSGNLTMDHAGLDPVGIAAVSAGLSREEARLGAEALRETAGHDSPVAGMGSELKNIGMGNPVERSGIESSHTAAVTQPKGGRER